MTLFKVLLLSVLLTLCCSDLIPSSTIQDQIRAADLISILENIDGSVNGTNGTSSNDTNGTTDGLGQEEPAYTLTCIPKDTSNSIITATGKTNSGGPTGMGAQQQDCFKVISLYHLLSLYGPKDSTEPVLKQIFTPFFIPGLGSIMIAP